ncbi:hypothetical protein D3C75_1348420 [compost metagenome]
MIRASLWEYTLHVEKRQAMGVILFLLELDDNVADFAFGAAHYAARQVGKQTGLRIVM